MFRDYLRIYRQLGYRLTNQLTMDKKRIAVMSVLVTVLLGLAVLTFFLAQRMLEQRRINAESVTQSAMDEPLDSSQQGEEGNAAEVPSSPMPDRPCGDGVCRDEETYTSCPKDCGAARLEGAAVESGQATVSWSSEVNSTAVIDYGIDGFEERVETSASAKQDSLILPNLKDGEIYSYRIQIKGDDGSVISEMYSEFIAGE